jgi:two-component system, cell cycle response regulator
VTLRARLTTAFLAVVLGPVLLGSFFVGTTVAAVTRERTVERLDHAVTTVRTSVGALCGRLQSAADAVAVLPAADRRAAADQLVARGLASALRVSDRSGVLFDTSGGPETSWRDCAAPDGRPATAIAARAEAGDVTVAAAQALDDGLLRRLTGAVGGDVRLLSPDTEPAAAERQDMAALAPAGAAPAAQAGDPYTRRIAAGPGQPLALAVSVPGGAPTSLYALLLAAVLAVGVAAAAVARWLARSTTRPLAELAWAAGRVAGGELDTRVPVERQDELGRLAGTFNRMTRELQAYVQALTASRDQLRRHLVILGDTLSSTHDLHRILEVILQTALSATGARAGLVLLVDPGGAELVPRCARGLTGRWAVPQAELPALRLPIGEGVLGAVAATGEPQRGPGAGLASEPPCRTYVAVPICAPAPAGDPLVPGEPANAGTPATLGVLALYDRLGGDEFDDADLVTLRTFAGQAGVAVLNVRVHEEAQRLSLTDPLTGLWNYRYLRESLRREVERASRFGRMLTVLVLDLDHFKEVNDRYGHAAGDTVLNEFAGRIRGCLREVDLAFRQGGEEFVVLLPETDAYGGATVAERLGAAVREIPVPIDRRRPDATTGPLVDRVPISVSIGIAVFPNHGATAQAVLAAADDALYAAKNAGRDTYRLADCDISVAMLDGNPTGAYPPRQGRGR